MIAIPTKLKVARQRHVVRELAKLKIPGLTLIECRPILQKAHLYDLIEVDVFDDGVIRAAFETPIKAIADVMAHKSAYVVEASLNHRGA